MCGRYTQMYTWEEIFKFSGATVPSTELSKRFNIAPTQVAPIVRNDESGKRTAELLHWGLIPSWSKDKKIAASLINARAETVAFKPSFRSAFKARRCLVPGSGFYEWQKFKDSKIKQPYYIEAKSKEPLFFAGLWEKWQSDKETETLKTFCIITTSANNLMSSLHDRMPVILNPAKFQTWLNPQANQAELASILAPCNEDLLHCYKVSTLVNSPRYDSEECIKEISSNAPKGSKPAF